MTQPEPAGNQNTQEPETTTVRERLSARHQMAALVHHLAHEEYGAPRTLKATYINVFGTGLIAVINTCVELKLVEQLDRAQGKHWVHLTDKGRNVAVRAMLAFVEGYCDAK